MRVRSGRSFRLLACLAMLLSTVLAAPVSLDASGTGVHLALATLLLATVFLIVTGAEVWPPSTRAAGRVRHTAGPDRAPVRQCDPDAAGHVRPRAPGISRTLRLR